jgi:hypothetical protein
MPIFWTEPCRCGKQIALDNRGDGIWWAKVDDKEVACCSSECAYRAASKESGNARLFVCPCCGAKVFEVQW